MFVVDELRPDDAGVRAICLFDHDADGVGVGATSSWQNSRNTAPSTGRSASLAAAANPSRRWLRSSRRDEGSGHRRRDPGRRVVGRAHCRARGRRALGSPGRRARPRRPRARGPGRRDEHRDDGGRRPARELVEIRVDRIVAAYSASTTTVRERIDPRWGWWRPGPELGSGVSMGRARIARPTPLCARSRVLATVSTCCYHREHCPARPTSRPGRRARSQAQWTSGNRSPTPATSPSASVSWAISRRKPAAASSASTRRSDGRLRRRSGPCAAGPGRSRGRSLDTRARCAGAGRGTVTQTCRRAGHRFRADERVEPVVVHVQATSASSPSGSCRRSSPWRHTCARCGGTAGLSRRRLVRRGRFAAALTSLTPMLVALAGGVGAARFLSGLVRACRPRRSSPSSTPPTTTNSTGSHVSPDLDSVTYTLAGASNSVQGWGLEGETFATLERAAALRSPTPGSASATGPRDAPLPHERLRAGASLSEVTAEITRAWGLDVRLLPMTDDPVRTRITVRIPTVAAPRSSRCRSGSSASGPNPRSCSRLRGRRPAARPRRGARCARSRPTRS